MYKKQAGTKKEKFEMLKCLYQRHSSTLDKQSQLIEIGIDELKIIFQLFFLQLLM